jgi:hypothetical protein
MTLEIMVDFPTPGGPVNSQMPLMSDAVGTSGRRTCVPGG